ncbi:MAG TPA: PadR family transcriptional regulator [Thermoanaerobaculia bacterium]|nr:PadR family transcriptional regulator [Thermoanaerobaculia bacterium]
MEGDALKGHLDMLVMAVVASGATYGYAVIEALRSRSGGRLDLPEGTIYPLLHRLEMRGLLRSRQTPGGRRKRVYRLTAAGQEALEQQREAWRSFAEVVGLVLAEEAP